MTELEFINMIIGYFHFKYFKIDGNNNELFFHSHAQFIELASKLNKYFDYVIIETPNIEKKPNSFSRFYYMLLVMRKKELKDEKFFWSAANLELIHQNALDYYNQHLKEPINNQDYSHISLSNDMVLRLYGWLLLSDRIGLSKPIAKYLYDYIIQISEDLIPITIAILMLGVMKKVDMNDYRLMMMDLEYYIFHFNRDCNLDNLPSGNTTRVLQEDYFAVLY